MRREKRSANGERDSVDRLAEAWEAAVPAFSTNSLHVFGRIQHLARFYEDALAHVARRHGLIPSDIYVLLALRRAPYRLNPAELIEELSVTSGAVTKSPLCSAPLKKRVRGRMLSELPLRIRA